MSETSRWQPGFLIVGVVLLLIGGLSTFGGVKAILNADESHAWESTRGKIIQSAPHIEYQYTVRGADHVGTKVGLKQSDPADLLKKYPKDAEVSVFYDPKQPDRALLEPGSDALTGAMTTLFGLVLLGFAAIDLKNARRG